MADNDDAEKKNLRTMIDVATNGLQTKNKELLEKLRKTQGKLDKLGDTDLDELLKAKSELEKLQQDKDKEDGDYKKLYDALKESSTTSTSKLQKKLDDTSGELVSLKKKTALSKALAEVHVDPIMLDAATKLLKSDVSVTEDGNFLGGDKPLKDFVKEWSAGDLGKKFVVAGNAGGGAQGPGGTPESEAEYFNKKSDNYSVTKQAEVAKRSPEKYKKYKAQFKSV